MSEASSGPGTALAITRVCAILAATDLALCGLIQAEDAMQEALRMAYWATLLVPITLVCVRIPPEGDAARGNIFFVFYFETNTKLVWYIVICGS